MGVRLISGDHRETAAAVARKVGIISRSDIGVKNAVMEPEEFLNEIGGGLDEKGELIDSQKFIAVMNELRVLARAKPDHKHIIV